MAESVDRAYRDNPEVSHETSDVNVKAILRFAAALAITAMVIHIALYVLMRYYERREVRRDVSRMQTKEEPPPEPRLRVAPRADLAEMRQAEDRLLDSYGWVDREKNIVRVPIEQAMEMVVQRGLPARKPAPRQSKEAGGKPATTGGQGR